MDFKAPQDTDDFNAYADIPNISMYLDSVGDAISPLMCDEQMALKARENQMQMVMEARAKISRAMGRLAPNSRTFAGITVLTDDVVQTQLILCVAGASLAAAFYALLAKRPLFQ